MATETTDSLVVRRPWTDYARLEYLSRPKPFHPNYRDDRRSVYWVEREPLRGGPDGYTQSVASARVSDLARHKVASSWMPHRPSPQWQVSRTAQSANPSTRVVQLSQHKTAVPKYLFDRDPQWDVIKSGSAVSERVEQLAVPKKREEQFSNFDPYWGFNIGVSETAKSAKASARLEALAEHKNYHKDFKNARTIQWDVSKEAIEAIASLRLQQLARPRSRTMIKDDYDPYKISAQAKKARATPRLDELCMPIPRKVRQKMTITAKS